MGSVGAAVQRAPPAGDPGRVVRVLQPHGGGPRIAQDYERRAEELCKEGAA